MAKLSCGFIAFLLFALVAARAQEAAPTPRRAQKEALEHSPSDHVAAAHPRLFTSRAELAELKRRFATEHAALARYLPPVDGPEAEIVPMTRGVTPQNSMILLARYALAYRVTGEKIYLDALARWLPEIEAYQPPQMESIGGSEGLTAGHVLLGAAMVYDFLEGEADPRTVGAFRALLQRQAETSFRDLSALRTLPYEQNHLVIPLCGLAVASLAVMDHEPAARSWLAFSENILEKSLRALGGDGWFFEGITYWNYTMQFPVCYGLVLKRVTGQDIFRAPIFHGGIPYLGHMMLPGGDLAFDFADWGPRVENDGKGFQAGYDLPWHTLPTRPKLFVPIALERELGGSNFSRDLIAFLAGRNRSKSGKTGNSFDTLFMLLWAVPDQASPSVLARTYPEVPTYKYYPDHGVVHWRENWSDPDAVAFAFKAGPPAGHAFAKLLKEDPRWKPSLGHAQPDAGSFILFAGGSFLAGDTGYTGKKETADHNSLLVDGIGQHKGGTAWATFEGKSYDEYAKIAIKEVWLNSVVAAVTTDLTAAYDDALRLGRVERKMMLVAGKYLLVADHLVSDVPHVYEWRWHSDRCAVIQGQTAEIRDRKVALVLNNLLPIDDMRVGATIVDTEVDANKAPRLQQRGYHISTKSKASPGHRFLTAGFVRRDAREKMKMAQRPDGVVTFSTANEQCTLWHQPSAGLAGSFAFTVCDRSGRVTLAGFKGTSFDTGDAGFSVKVSKTASLLLRIDDDAVEIESTDKGDSVEVTLLQSGREKRAMVGAQPVRLVLK